jgi:hypothetical protein
MSNTHPFRGPLCALLAGFSAISCGSDSNQADPYNGVLTSYTIEQAWDSKFLPQAAATGCIKDPATGKNDGLFPAYPCYEPQQGFANGSAVWFYNIGSIKTSTLPNPLPTSVADPQALGGGGTHVDVFPHSCVPGPAINVRTDAYAKAVQFPIFNTLPLATTAFGAIVWPIAAEYGVNLTSNETCNDLKDSRSIADASNPGGGSYGATRTALPTTYELMAIVDSTSAIGGPLPGQLNPNYGAAFGWYEGLLLRYLDGGPIPTISVTNNNGVTTTALQVMDGIILDSASAYAATTDQKVILLPAAPGDDAYSPIVNLHDYTLESGKKPGDYVGICTASMTNCPANFALMSKAKPAAFATVFIASTPQQAQ